MSIHIKQGPSNISSSGGHLGMSNHIKQGPSNMSNSGGHLVMSNHIKQDIWWSLFYMDWHSKMATTAGQMFNICRVLKALHPMYMYLEQPQQIKYGKSFWKR
jgi:hypothetical protein